MIQLPENFEAGFLRMKQLKESGRKVVGIFCSFVPTELIEAAGGTAAPLCATSEEPISAAEADLPKNLCPLIKASYGFALTDTCPYFYFSDFIVGETTCDGKKKMFELMDNIKETYVMQLPARRDEAALDAWEKEVVRFWKKLEDFYGITITEEDVKKAIKVIEALGADVVAFDCCNGTREKVEKVDETLPAARALAKKYLNINCSVMSPNETRMDYISNMIDEYQVDGVLELILCACHTYSIEAYNVKKTAMAQNVPYLMIETDYSKADSGQINTRLEAFLEKNSRRNGRCLSDPCSKNKKGYRRAESTGRHSRNLCRQ